MNKNNKNNRDNKDIILYITEHLKKQKSTNGDNIEKIKKYMHKNNLNLKGGVLSGDNILAKLSPINEQLLAAIETYKQYNTSIESILNKIKDDLKEDIYAIQPETTKHIKDNIIQMKKTINNLINGRTDKQLNADIKTIKTTEEQVKFKNFIELFRLYVSDYNQLVIDADNLQNEDVVNKLIEKFKLTKINIMKLSKVIKLGLNELQEKIKKIKATETGYNVDDIVVVQDNSEVYNYYNTIKVGIQSGIQDLIVQDNYKLEHIVSDLITKSETTFSDIDYYNKHEPFTIVEGLQKVLNTPIILFGGDIKNVYNLQNELINFTKDIEDTINDIDLYKIMIIVYNEYSVRYRNYMLYILAILDHDKYTQNLLVFKYINKGILSMYHRIIKEILAKIGESNKDNIYRYFDINHRITLSKLDEFLTFILTDFVKSDKVAENNKTTFIINVKESIGNSRFMFTLLSHFKDLLDVYRDKSQNKVRIYGRINDWGDIPDKMFLINEMTDYENLKINTKACKRLNEEDSIKYDGYKVKFEELYDTERYKENETISSYMALSSQIAKGRGILMLTYGYSGTGKTFTLFGSSKKQGLLQSTLNGIHNLRSVGFRSYEIYGLGVAYPHYWDKNIYQRIFTHNINIIDNKIVFKTSNEIDCKYSTDFLNTLQYTFVEDNNIIEVFKSFSSYTSQLDAERKKTGRIKFTPNNPESSRSIIVYDLILLIEETDSVTNKIIKKYVPFVIIDLPGREEIAQTYVETYLKRDFIPPKYKTPFYEALLGCIAINPIGLALLVPSMIFKTSNEMEMSPMEKDYNVVTEEFKNKVFNSSGHHLKDLHAFSGKNISLENNKNHNGDFSPSGQKEIAIIIDNISKPLQIPTRINSIQYQAVVAIFLMNELITKNKFNVLQKLYKKIIDTYFDMSSIVSGYKNKSIDDKIKFLKDNIDHNLVAAFGKDNVEIDNAIDEVINFNYFLAQHEGIYINENIMGLLKHIVEKVLINGKEGIIESQPKDLDFDKQVLVYRNINESLYAISPEQLGTIARGGADYNFESNKINYEQYENVSRNKLIIDQMYKNALGNKVKYPKFESIHYFGNGQYEKHENGEQQIDSYSSQKIFQSDNPFMGKIIDYYMSETKTYDKIPVKGTSDVKIFYLFSNTQMELKCGHQMRLLINTLPLIDAVKN